MCGDHIRCICKERIVLGRLSGSGSWSQINLCTTCNARHVIVIYSNGCVPLVIIRENILSWYGDKDQNTYKIIIRMDNMVSLC